MKTRQLKTKIGSAILGLSMLGGMGLATTTPTQAKNPSYGGQGQRDRDRDNRDRDNRDRDNRDRDNHDRDNRDRENRDRDNRDRDNRDRDNRDRDNRDRDYRDQDRNQGNNRGWRRRSNDDYPNWGGSFQLRQTALNAGYNEGLKEGRKDRSKGRRFNFSDSNAFQKATKDYNSRAGDRELHRRYFRLAFENGYEAGYNGY